jgi:hypothetical protein
MVAGVTVSLRRAVPPVMIPRVLAICLHHCENTMARILTFSSCLSRVYATIVRLTLRLLVG